MRKREKQAVLSVVDTLRAEVGNNMRKKFIPSRCSPPSLWILSTVRLRVKLVFVSWSKAQSTFIPSIKRSALLELFYKLQNKAVLRV